MSDGHSRPCVMTKSYRNGVFFFHILYSCWMSRSSSCAARAALALAAVVVEESASAVMVKVIKMRWTVECVEPRRMDRLGSFASERASLVSQIQISTCIGTSSKWFLEFEFEFEFEWDIQKTRKIRKIQDLSKWRAHQLESRISNLFTLANPRR